MEKTLFTREYTLLRQMLRETRERKGMTQEELATKIDETQSFVSKCERGERRLDLVQLHAVCAALGRELSEFTLEFERRLANSKKRDRRSMS